MASSFNHRQFVGPTACSGWQQRKHQRFVLLVLCQGNTMVNNRFSPKRTSKAESSSMSWRHHVTFYQTSFSILPLPVHTETEISSFSMKFSSLAALSSCTFENFRCSQWWKFRRNFHHWLHRKLSFFTTSGAANDENLIKMTTFPFQWQICLLFCIPG